RAPRRVPASRPLLRASEGDRRRPPARAAFSRRRPAARTHRSPRRTSPLRVAPRRRQPTLRRLEGRGAVVRLRRGPFLGLVGSAVAGGPRRPAPPPVAIGVGSHRAGPTHAAITARIQVSGEQPGRRTGDQPPSPRPGGVEPQPVSNAHTAAATAPPVLYPS